MNISQFRSRDVRGSQEISSRTRDDALPLSRTTSNSITSPTQVIQPLFSVPIRRSEQQQRLLQARVSGEEEPFCPDDASPHTEPIVAIALPGQDQVATLIEPKQQTDYPYNKAFPTVEVLQCAIIDYVRRYKATPKLLCVSSEFLQQISNDVREVFGKDFDGTMPSPFPSAPNISLSFSTVPSNIVICTNQYFYIIERVIRIVQ